MKTPWQRATEGGYQRQESRTARKRGARPQINSGRTWSSLRDVKLNSPVSHVLIDNKTTETISFRITLDEFAKLKRDANRTPPGCLPALQIDIRDLRLMVIEDAHWDEIMDYIRILEERIRELEGK